MAKGRKAKDAGKVEQAKGDLSKPRANKVDLPPFANSPSMAIA